MRAIGRRMGVDRKAVRAALVEAGLIVDATDDSHLDCLAGSDLTD